MTQMFTTKMNTLSFQQHEEIDNLSRSFNNQLLSAHDCYRSFMSNSLINTTRRYINTKLKYEDNSINFIEEIRRKLYLIHDYNLEIFKLTHKYPRIRNFDLLLVKYIELEYEILYGNGKNVDKYLEREVGQRIYRLLYIILQYCTVEDGLLTGTVDITTKEAILQVFVDIKFQYFKEGRFLYNITSKLINDIDAKCNISSCNLLFHYLKANFSTSKNLTTSDYGSDDSDTDEVENIDSSHCTNTQIRPVEISLINTSNTNDIEEVPVTKNGIQPIVTFELINDDDDDYMVYLTEKDDSHQSDKNKNCDKIGDPTRINTNSNNNNNKGDNANVVVLSSDSENDSIRSTKTNRKKKKRLKNQQKRSVVTFEIVDDDDDDDGDNANSYMVYLGKEVENLNKRKKLTIEDPVILSDSDNDNVGNIKKEPMEIDIKIESSIEEVTESQNMLNQSNQIKIEPVEIDLKDEIIEEHNNDQLTSELYPRDPCLNMDKIDSTLIVQNNTNVGNLTDSSLNNSFLEEMLETSYLSKKDFEDLECFVFDTSGQHSFSRYCEQSSDNDDGISENKLV